MERPGDAERNPDAAPRACLAPPGGRVDPRALAWRRAYARVVRRVWLGSVPVFIYGLVLAGWDGHPQRTDATILAGLFLAFDVSLAMAYWVVVVPRSRLAGRPPEE